MAVQYSVVWMSLNLATIPLLLGMEAIFIHAGDIHIGRLSPLR